MSELLSQEMLDETREDWTAKGVEPYHTVELQFVWPLFGHINELQRQVERLRKNLEERVLWEESRYPHEGFRSGCHDCGAITTAEVLRHRPGCPFAALIADMEGVA